MKRKSLHDQLADRCIHFNGLMNKACDAGMRYDDVDAGHRVAYRAALPCLKDRHLGHGVPYTGPMGHCPHVKFPTEEEVQRRLASIEQHHQRMQAALDAVAPIRKEHKGKYWTGTIKCPVCEGTLHVRHHGNGQVHARCETKDCVAWME